MAELTNLAGVVIEKDHGLLLLHRNFEGVRQWEMPGGKVEPGETQREAAKREAMEELGVEVEIISHIGFTAFKGQERNYRYDWFSADIAMGTPTTAEEMFDDLDYFQLDGLQNLRQSNGLSANMLEFLKLLEHEEVIL